MLKQKVKNTDINIFVLQDSVNTECDKKISNNNTTWIFIIAKSLTRKMFGNTIINISDVI